MPLCNLQEYPWLSNTAGGPHTHTCLLIAHEKLEWDHWSSFSRRFMMSWKGWRASAVGNSILDKLSANMHIGPAQIDETPK